MTNHFAQVIYTGVQVFRLYINLFLTIRQEAVPVPVQVRRAPLAGRR